MFPVLKQAVFKMLYLNTKRSRNEVGAKMAGKNRNQLLATKERLKKKQELFSALKNCWEQKNYQALANFGNPEAMFKHAQSLYKEAIQLEKDLKIDEKEEDKYDKIVIKARSDIDALWENIDKNKFAKVKEYIAQHSLLTSRKDQEAALKKKILETRKLQKNHRERIIDLRKIAVKFLKKATKNGNLEACCFLANKYLESGYKKKAEEAYLFAANRGSSSALSSLKKTGLMPSFWKEEIESGGTSVNQFEASLLTDIKRDNESALYYYALLNRSTVHVSLAAGYNNLEAMSYEVEHEDVEKDTLEDYAKFGCIPAMESLASLAAEKGENAEAVGWLEKAENHRKAESLYQCEMGDLHENPDFVDESTLLDTMLEAADLGSMKAAYYVMKDCEKKISEAESKIRFGSGSLLDKKSTEDYLLQEMKKMKKKMKKKLTVIKEEKELVYSEKNENVVSRKLNDLKKYYKQRIQLAGDRETMHFIYQLARLSTGSEKGYLLSQAAEKGHPEAVYQCAKWHQDQASVCKRKIAQTKVIEKAVKKGDLSKDKTEVYLQFIRENRAMKGHLKTHEENVERYFLKSGKMGNKEAYRDLATYFEGRGDFNRAEEMQEEAAYIGDMKDAEQVSEKLVTQITAIDQAVNKIDPDTKKKRSNKLGAATEQVKKRITVVTGAIRDSFEKNKDPQPLQDILRRKKN